MANNTRKEVLLSSNTELSYISSTGIVLQQNAHRKTSFYERSGTYRKRVAVYLVRDGFRCRLPAAVVELKH